MDGGTIYRARGEDLVVRELGNELLIYDRRADVAHCLTETAALVWRRCEDGATLDQMVDSVMARIGAAVDGRGDAETTVLRAIDELQEKALLREGAAPGLVSRRQALRRMAGVGAGAALAPLVVSAAVPKPAEAFGSPLTCLGKNSATKCATASTCGTTAGNNCCPAGSGGCHPGSGSGVGGCFCGTDQLCHDCATSGNPPDSKCPSACTTNPTCSGTAGTANPCCCSGFCSTKTAGQCG
jgi:hypothetical protein